MNPPVLLVRHAPVAKRWHGRCYGQTDVGLSREGYAIARNLAVSLASRKPTLVIHSGLRRTRMLAEMIGRASACRVTEDGRWKERDFGDWEAQRWKSVYRQSGSEMDRMLSEPDGFRPGGGETTSELIARVRAAWIAVPDAEEVIIVGHGGSIAGIRAHLAGAELDQIVSFVPRCGEIIELAR